MPIKDFPSNDFTLLHVEYWALQLLIELVLIDYDVGVSARSANITRQMTEALTLPIYQQTKDHFEGITEGLCRMVLASWVLREYKAMCKGVDFE